MNSVESSSRKMSSSSPRTVDADCNYEISFF